MVVSSKTHGGQLLERIRFNKTQCLKVKKVRIIVTFSRTLKFLCH